MWYTGTVAALVLTLVAGPASAQDRRGNDEAIRKLEREIAQLRADVKKLQESRRGGPEARAGRPGGGQPGFARRGPGGSGGRQQGFARRGPGGPGGFAQRGSGYANRPGFARSGFGPQAQWAPWQHHQFQRSGMAQRGNFGGASPFGRMSGGPGNIGPQFGFMNRPGFGVGPPAGGSGAERRPGFRGSDRPEGGPPARPRSDRPANEQPRPQRRTPPPAGD